MNGPHNEIGCAPCPKCCLCAHEGLLIHSNLRDRLFGASGSWNLKKCVNPACGLAWLDPMPLPQEIGKAYVQYYTHATSPTTKQETRRKRLSRFVKEGYWATKYRYKTSRKSGLAQRIGILLYLSPIHRREADAEIRCLSAVPNGRLLDVGCGSGEWLLTMQKRGWQVEGLDFDANAVKAAEARGVHVRIGSLEDQRFPDNYFNAITLSHVIEHVPDPAATIEECFRVLKPGGTVVLLTPNNDSLSHRIFKGSWRGLEPPRHLHIFSLRSMELLLANTGFRQRVVRPFIVTSVIYDSLLLRWGRSQGAPRSWPAWILARLFKLLELPLIKLSPDAGDCLIATAVKH